MRTTSAKPEKGAERARTLADDARLLAGIAAMLFVWVWRGRRVRREFAARRRRGEKYFVDEA